MHFPIKTCENELCKKSYPPKREKQRFCCKACRDEWHTSRYVRWIKEGKAREGV